MFAVMAAATLMAVAWAALLLRTASVAAAVMPTVWMAPEAHPLAHDEACGEARYCDDDAMGNGKPLHKTAPHHQ
jgi:hypothetical protein